MNYTTLISTEALADHLGDPNWAVIDCRFTLGNDLRGRHDYLKAHIPGAIYAHLNEDLCGTVIPGETGRHPLPDIHMLEDKFSRWGISSKVQVVAYDDWPGIGLATAARLWWSLRWLGHEKVAVLDGGWERWIGAGYPQKSGTEVRPVSKFVPTVHPEFFADSDLVDQTREDSAWRVVDSRSADRFRGENETIDPVAGHIPGALSFPYTANIDAAGLFQPAQSMRTRFEDALGNVPAANVVFYCGSGVTAAVNALSMAHAGLGNARLYVGSWSDWINDPRHPVV